MAVTVSVVLGLGAGILLGPLSHRNGPADTVRRFFTAIRDGDAAAALAELRDPPQDTTFITNPVLAAAQSAFPLTDISVTPTTATAVPVTYRLNQETITDVVSVAQVGNQYRIVSDLNKGGIALRAQRRAGLTMYLAGIEVSAERVFLLPGIYPITSSSPLLSYGRSGQVAVPRLQDSPGGSGFSVQLTSEGRSKVAATVLSSLAGCAAQRSYTPTGCPFGYQQPVPAPDTASWKITAPTEQDVRITPSPADLTTSTVEVTVPSLRLVFPPGSSPEVLDLGSVQAVGRVDLLVADPKIVWTAGR